MRQRRDGTTTEELRDAGLRVTSLQVLGETLHALPAAELVRPSNRPAARPGSRTRRAVAGVDRAVGEDLCLTASHDHGFSIHEAEVTSPVPRLLHRPQFLTNVIRPVRKDSHV
ncbi:hypothetical protein [Streptomyces sp. NPDC051219]|uniref:hypothetical protein n=1 Tax=Streptomyces sp. NPDC051219 TaxID=3155283 RepID=UPI003420EC39